MELSYVELDTVAVIKYALNPVTENLPYLHSKWADIEKELSVQTVAFLPANALSSLGVSEEERSRYMLAFANSMRRFHQIMQEQEKLAVVLDGIEYVILKGAAAAMYYLQPMLRQMGDIDILVHPQDFERAVGLLEEAHYRKGSGYERHIGFRTASGLEIELHRRFSASNNKRQNVILDEMLFQAISRRETRIVCGYRVPVLPKLENGLVLLSHINQHLSSGLGLRQIIDWLLYVKENLDDAFWEDHFREAAEAIGMRQLAETATKLCVTYFGLENAGRCMDSDAALADELLLYLFQRGNFGRKNHLSNPTLTVMHKFAKPGTAFRYLTDGGMSHWKAARKHRILKPFVRVYQIAHLIRKGLARKVRLSKFIEEAKQSKYESELLDRLKVTRK